MPKIEEDQSFQREESKILEKDNTVEDMDAFFENTSEREFNEYMQKLDGSDEETPNSDFDPTANPSSPLQLQLLKQKLVLKLDSV